MTDAPTLSGLLGIILCDWMKGNKHPYYHLTIRKPEGAASRAGAEEDRGGDDEEVA